MRTASIAVVASAMVLMLVALDRPSFAQGGDKAPVRREKSSVSEVPAPPESMMTPDLWLYMREQQKQDDPKLYLREIARQKGNLRRARMESQKWYGYSASRPTANPMPMMGTYSGMWAGNSNWNELYWHPYQPAVAVYPAQTYVLPR
jgi:hypothetical protein